MSRSGASVRTSRPLPSAQRQPPSEIEARIGEQIAALVENGAIIALPSTAARGTVSRITTQLKPGAGVVTTRGHVHWVVTEYGAHNLHGLTLRERGEALTRLPIPTCAASCAAPSRRSLRHYVMP